MEEERFVWSIWRTQVSTLNWIKSGREGDRNERGDNLDKWGKISKFPQKIGRIDYSRSIWFALLG